MTWGPSRYPVKVKDPETGNVVHTFSVPASTEVATTRFSDGANRRPGGRAVTLLRTARGRHVVMIESDWIEEPTLSFWATVEGDLYPWEPDDTVAMRLFSGPYDDRWIGLFCEKYG